jgi:hypothetical protein
MLINLRFAMQHPFVTLGVMIGALPFSIGAVVLAMGTPAAGAAMVLVGLLIWAAAIYGLVRALRAGSGEILFAKKFIYASDDDFAAAMSKVGYRRSPDGTWQRPDAPFVIAVLPAEVENGPRVLTVTGPWPKPLDEVESLKQHSGLVIHD